MLCAYSYPTGSVLDYNNVKMKMEPTSHTRHQQQRYHPYIRHVSQIPRIIEDRFQTSAALFQPQEHLMMLKVHQERFQTSASLYQTQENPMMPKLNGQKFQTSAYLYQTHQIPKLHEEPFQTRGYLQPTARYQGLPQFNEEPVDIKPFSHQTLRQDGLLKVSKKLFQNSVLSQELSRTQDNMALVSLLREGQGHCQTAATSNSVSPYLPTGYTYPTLTCLLPSISEDNTHEADSISRLTGKHNIHTTSSKEKMVEQLHPFHRRQLLTMAHSREGLTRTRDKYRVVYTEKQKKLLEDEYEKNNFIPESRRADLASETGLSDRQIKFWFQNRRAKDKRMKTTTKNGHNNTNMNVSQKSTSKTATNHTGSLIKENHQSELPSCKYKKEPVIDNNTSPDSQDDQTADFLTETCASPSFFSGSCMYSSKQSMNQSESLTTGSCRFENTAKRSPTSGVSQLKKQHPVSPSEWTVTSQHSYLLNKAEMSPLFNGLQPSFDFRM